MNYQMDYISENKKFYTTDELKDLGYSYYRISKLETAGRLRRINKKVYENLICTADENDFFSAEAYVPEGVICLMSAARHYGLTDFLPDSVDVAIDRKKKVSTLPEWPEIKLHYFDPRRMDIGVREVEEGENSYRIFDIEKTVIDVIYYRNKVGIEETSNVLKNYLGRPARNVDLLYEYSKQLRCEKTVRTYLEVLI